jgi:hypothetical protein
MPNERFSCAEYVQRSSNCKNRARPLIGDTADSANPFKMLSVTAQTDYN